jgi:Ca2+:H+ antiporter
LKIASNKPKFLPVWSAILPIIGWIFLALTYLSGLAWLPVLLFIGILISVQASVHHAEVIAVKIGEPFGTLVLALSVTVIEVALITAILVKSGGETSFVARDTIFATVMIILNGLVGICLLLGGVRHHEQGFALQGVNASLVTLSVLAVLTLILPNYTTSLHGPEFSSLQLGFVATVSLILYGIYILIQTVWHRDYFQYGSAEENNQLAKEKPSTKITWMALGLLLFSLGAVVLQAKALSPTLSEVVEKMGAPEALVGVVIALIVLMPESTAAIRAARSNRIQTSLNLALGSALATIGLTIPAIAAVSIATGWSLPLGLDAKGSVLLALSLLVSIMSLGTGRTTVLQGAVHLVIFAVFLFTTVFP